MQIYQKLKKRGMKGKLKLKSTEEQDLIVPIKCQGDIPQQRWMVKNIQTSVHQLHERFVKQCIQQLRIPPEIPVQAKIPFNNLCQPQFETQNLTSSSYKNTRSTQFYLSRISAKMMFKNVETNPVAKIIHNSKKLMACPTSILNAISIPHLPRTADAECIKEIELHNTKFTTKNNKLAIQPIYRISS